jgi:Xaa-Pro aminopeptidase
MDWIRSAQQGLEEADIDAWLLYDFRGSNPTAHAIIRPLLAGGVGSRRVLLLIPREGDPVLLVHAIERGSLPELPFEVRSYGSRGDLEREAARLVRGARRVAMEYSPEGDNPYVGSVDAGTVEFVRGLGVEVVSSGDVAQALNRWTPGQLDAHLDAAEVVLAAKDHAFAFLAERTGLGQEVRETEVQHVITAFFDERGFSQGHPSNVSFGAHAGDPHYVPREGADAVLCAGDVVLIDLWAKRAHDLDAPYADVTWMAVSGEPSSEVADAFDAVREARDAAFRALCEAYAAGRYPEGREIDRAARAVLDACGHGPAFFHRTGHSLGCASTHGDAAHLDDFETRERRRLLPGVGVTIEPGVYYPHFGVRSEIDVWCDAAGPRATTDLQGQLLPLPSPR